MTKDEFADALTILGLSRAGLARELAARTGMTMAESTLYRYAKGQSDIPIGLAAYLKLRVELETVARELKLATL